MKKLLQVIALSTPALAIHANTYYGTGLCGYPQYECIKVSSGQTWESLFPDPQQRDIVQRLNRTYNHLWAGKEIAVPKNMANKTMLDFSPFPLKIEPGEKQVIVDQDKLAWAAYDVQGHLVKWGPISSGSDVCSDHSSKTCRTMTGIFHFFSKENEKCRSNVFPVGKGGAKMPYCMYFHKGFALHGAQDIPGYRASHGCVRMFTEDAKWMNHEFIDLSNDKTQTLGTKVIVRPLIAQSEKKQ
ncbi:L,D-transpeptidase [Legionella jordanis]|uniref:Enhanced entry protein EnhA n=1 Tax=Legionella jordanis TaxID=456 RepID=A0A0W0V969_9GAMM|nr:L,D-transpeptidase [Legionella jordanis]KTD16628.1 enhanced entry protein EnhA [Legionella jordanis]RMX03835.1 L,D-transpeptidase [Legionella jordanis]RMX22102.1 L,D-transpeptidase [Legionella jordanis]VEH11908.1 enhanced entry protein EnhA [Legionella jordanis]HAT8712788.1 L,D-transpeptidase family protein [Legionella jordanis]